MFTFPGHIIRQQRKITKFTFKYQKIAKKHKCSHTNCTAKKIITNKTKNKFKDRKKKTRSVVYLRK